MKNEWDNEQPETRRMWRKNIIHAEQSEAGNFLEKVWKKGPKIHYLAIKSFFLTKKCQEVHKR